MMGMQVDRAGSALATQLMEFDAGHAGRPTNASTVCGCVIVLSRFRIVASGYL